ncbi:MAG: Transcription factor WhiB [Streptosporangiaceae bacterium]|nr:Transcription factor WhiB [Streptosporangiaceae bacterium]
MSAAMKAVVGRCRDCNQLMATRGPHKELGLAEHSGKGICSMCRTRRRRDASLGEQPVPPARPYWMESSNRACSGADPETFYPVSDKPQFVTPAKTVCGGCRYRAACLTWAVENQEKWGVWGGLSAGERQGLTLESLGADVA